MSPFAYYELKAAHTLFARAPDALDPAQKIKAEAAARRYARIEAAVLASPEAADVCLTAGAVERARAELRGRYPDDAAWSTALTTVGLDEDTLAEALARDLRVDAALERVGARAGAVGDTECEIFYYAHRDRFRSPERRMARHILVTVNETLADNGRDAARHRIDDIARRLAARPERFEEQAMKHSECPTALNGGSLGTIPRGVLYPELETALFALDAGGLSAVVESELGFHLLRCDGVEPERVLAYAEVAESLRARLTAERAQSEWRRWLAGLLAVPHAAAD